MARGHGGQQEAETTHITLWMWHPCRSSGERAGTGFAREAMVSRRRGSPNKRCLPVADRPEKDVAIWSPPHAAGFPVAFLVTPQRLEL